MSTPNPNPFIGSMPISSSRAVVVRTKSGGVFQGGVLSQLDPYLILIQQVPNLIQHHQIAFDQIEAITYLSDSTNQPLFFVLNKGWQTQEQIDADGA